MQMHAVPMDWLENLKTLDLRQSDLSITKYSYETKQIDAVRILVVDLSEQIELKGSRLE